MMSRSIATLVPRVAAGAAAGVLATATMDMAMLVAARADARRFSSERIDPQIIGRWAAGLLRFRCRHADITAEPQVPCELALGIATHYATGVALTEAFLLAPVGPTVERAAAYGVATSVLPLLILFPSLGYGPFARRSEEMWTMNRAMLVGHVAFGVGIGFWGRRLLRSARD